MANLLTSRELCEELGRWASVDRNFTRMTCPVCNGFNAAYFEEKDCRDEWEPKVICINCKERDLP